MVLPDQPLDFTSQAGIVQHPQVGAEDRTIVLAELLRYGIAIGSNLLICPGNCVRESFDLILHRFARNEPLRNSNPFIVHNQSFAYGDTG